MRSQQKLETRENIPRTQSHREFRVIGNGRFHQGLNMVVMGPSQIYHDSESNRQISARDKSPMDLRLTRNTFQDH